MMGAGFSLFNIFEPERWRRKGEMVEQLEYSVVWNVVVGARADHSEIGTIKRSS